MAEARKPASQIRADFRKALTSGVLQRMPGAHSPIVAMALTRMGVEGLYLSGAAMSAELGLPDIGLTTLSEICARGHQITRTTDLPVMIDADTGFGEPMNCARTVRELEYAGLAACHIEDQVNPKRCGHLDKKQVVETGTMVKRIKAATMGRRDENFVIFARTDAKALEGIDSAIARANAYVDAGADAIFPEALHTVEEFEAFRKGVNAPLMANMTEFGKSPLLTTAQLTDLGYNVVIYPVTTLRLAMKAIEDAFTKILEDGTQADLLDRMQPRSELYKLLEYDRYNQFDNDIFNFELKAGD